MKRLIQQIVKVRNPNFKFDESLNGHNLTEFAINQVLAIVRGCFILFRFKLPKFMLRGRNVHFIACSRIKYGRFLKLGNNVTLSGLGKKGLSIGNNVGIGSFSNVIVSTSLNNIGKGITICNNVGIGEFAYLGGAGGLTIGSNCIIGQYFSCHPENHNYHNLSTLIRHQGVNRKGIEIQSNCWIGSKVTILDGVSVGEGSIIAAGAVLTQSFPANSVIGGVPAKLLKKRE